MEQQQQQQQKKKKQHQNPPPSHLIASFSSCDPYPAPSSYPYPAHPPPPPPPPAPPVHSSLYYYSAGYSAGNYGNPMAGRANFAPYHAYHSLGWSAPGIRPPPPMTGSLLPPPPPYVEHQQAKKVRNDVNVHKDTLRLEVDEQNSDHHLISFVFDALFDGRTGWG